MADKAAALLRSSRCVEEGTIHDGGMVIINIFNTIIIIYAGN